MMTMVVWTLTAVYGEQQDVFSMTSVHLLQQMQKNPITWADSESINNYFHNVMHRMYEERVIPKAERHAGSRLCIRVNATELKALGVARRLDISALKCLYFTFSTPQPLRVLFSASIMHKYSRLATFLLQVKAVESAIIKVGCVHVLCGRRVPWRCIDGVDDVSQQFKRSLRYKRCFKQYVALVLWRVTLDDRLRSRS